MQRFRPYLLCLLVFVVLGPLLVVPLTAVAGFVRNADFRLLNPLTLAPAALSGYLISDSQGGFPSIRTGVLFLVAFYLAARTLSTLTSSAFSFKRLVAGAVLGLLSGICASVPVILGQLEQIRRFPPGADSLASALAKWLPSHAENVAIGIVGPAVLCGAVALCLVRHPKRPSDA
jgi:hypothetical protein